MSNITRLLIGIFYCCITSLVIFISNKAMGCAESNGAEPSKNTTQQPTTVSQQPQNQTQNTSAQKPATTTNTNTSTAKPATVTTQ